MANGPTNHVWTVLELLEQTAVVGAFPSRRAVRWVVVQTPDAWDDSMSFEGKFGFQAAYPPCPASLLDEFEASLAPGRLPTDYRDFLLQWNGGRFSPKVKVGFPLQDQEDEFDCGRVFHFFGLFEPDHNFDLRRASYGYGFREAVPNSYIAIGDEYHWDQVCISTNGSDAGCVYWWNPGEPWPKEPAPTRSFLRPVAGSFGEFWTSLLETT